MKTGKLTVSTSDALKQGPRLDAYLAQELADLSRSRLQNFIKDGLILLNGKKTKARVTLKNGDEITLNIPDEPDSLELIPQDIPLDILFEDEHLIVLNKSPGLVVHPADGNPDGTLVNALLHHTGGQLSGAGEKDNIRPGIVHRLDKDTSGCLVAAKTIAAHQSLVQQFSNRETAKLYLAVAQSTPKLAHQSVFNNIGRHPVNRQRMAVVNPGSGKAAITDIHLLYPAADGSALLLCALHTGRTHQIRVHTQYLGHPLLGDPLYAKPARQKPHTGRLMLHAWRLGFTHPASGKWLQNEAPLPIEYVPWTDPSSEKLAKIRTLEAKNYDALNAL